MGELASERRAVSRAISALRLTPVLFELGARPHPPQAVYRAYLAQSDVFIGLYWQQYGWVGPGMEVSGLEDEFDLSAGMPRLLYMKAPAPERDPRLTELLDRIRAEAAASYRTFHTAAQLGRLVRDDLATLLSEHFAAARIPPSTDVGSSSVTQRTASPLPAGATSLFGRESAIGEVSELVQRPDVRLVTLTGPGGVGKTRLALAAGERLHDVFSAGTVFVPLAAVTDPGLVLDSVARAVGADLGGAESPVQVLAEWFDNDQWLLILDNLEQVVGAAGDLGDLIAHCPGTVILATSRTGLGLAAEWEYPVPPLALPVDDAAMTLKDMESSPAVALFMDRARAVRPDFTLTAGNREAVALVCRRLEGLPLAVELAAARTRLLNPAALLDRLTASLDALGTGAVDLPERQRTLRATVEWSVGLLDDDERSLLETVVVFVDGWTIDAAAKVAGLEEDRALELFEALARHSLIQLDAAGYGPRCSMLQTIRTFVSERLAARPDVGEIQRRHAMYYRALVEQADRPLRGAEGQSEWLEMLQAEARNLAAAIHWYLTHDPAPLPHLFRILWPFWHLRDRQAEARPWVEELRSKVTALDPEARAELEWTAMVTATEVGDDAAALAVRRNLAPLMDAIRDPLLSATCRLGMAWTSPITGDYDAALREVSVSVEQFHRLDEPFWTALAVYTAAALEMAVGRPDRAVQPLREMGDLADRFDFTWLTVGYRAQLGTLAILQGRPDQARELLHEAMDLSLEIRITRYVTLCLAGLAHLALVEGSPERAALLAGASEGLRMRARMGIWPVHRRGEAELVSQIRLALGADKFDQTFRAGSAMSQREAVAIVREGLRGA